MAGRIMTRMTTDVDQFETLIENGLLPALVALVTFVGVGVALVLIDVELGAVDAEVSCRWRSRRSSSGASPTGCTTVSRERIAIVNADFQERLSGDPRVAGVRARGPRPSSASTGSAALLRRRGCAAQRTIATYFPFVQFLSAVADVIVLGVGAAPDRAGPADAPAR